VPGAPVLFATHTAAQKTTLGRADGCEFSKACGRKLTGKRAARCSACSKSWCAVILFGQTAVRSVRLGHEMGLVLSRASTCLAKGRVAAARRFALPVLAVAARAAARKLARPGRAVRQKNFLRHPRRSTASPCFRMYGPQSVADWPADARSICRPNPDQGASSPVQGQHNRLHAATRQRAARARRTARGRSSKTSVRRLVHSPTLSPHGR